MPADGSSAVTTVAPSSPPLAPPPTPPPSLAGDAPLDAGADAPPDASGVDADAGAAPIVADNKVDPTAGAELQERAKGLFQAIVTDEPERAEAFWFPREPFLPLKDIKDPGKYWVELHHSYVTDIHALHKKRKHWRGAEFVKFEGWARTKWVAPGKEANKIGYHRAFDGKLRYTIDGKAAAIDVHTIITWQGRWYVTHLRKVRR